MTELDRTIFLFLNSLHSPWVDNVMWIVSMRAVWIPLYLFIVYLLVMRYRKRVWLVLVAAGLLVVITDQVSGLVKDLVQRPRPCHDPVLQGLVHTIRGYCGGMYGFVSSHAANTFGVAAFAAPLVRRKWFSYSIFAWAALVSYSRIYLGVHYPGDVIGGAVLGLIAGGGLAFASIRIYQRTE